MMQVEIASQLVSRQRFSKNIGMNPPCFNHPRKIFKDIVAVASKDTIFVNNLFMFLPFLRNFPHLVIMKCKPVILYEWSSIAHATVSIMLSYFVLILFSLQIIYQACSTRLPHCPCRGREYVMRFRLSVHPLSRSRPPTVLSLRAIAMFWPSH